jgi:epoxyqueuosine reductase
MCTITSHWNNLRTTIVDTLKKNGYKAKIISINRIYDLENELNKIKVSFSSNFFQERLSFFQFQKTLESGEAKSIIITAAKQNPIEVIFNYRDNILSTIVPPTYSYHTDSQIRKIIQQELTEGLFIEDAKLPLRPLAVFSGLAQYGRNNITYIKNMGSFFRLKAFLSNIEPGKENAINLSFKDDCEKCNICIKACPTKAISQDHFLINAERCITYLNEKPNIFPEWINPKWHNCLIGCMRCQFYCPLNLEFRNTRDGRIEFDSYETELIISSTPLEELPHESIRKLEYLNLKDDFNLLPRNLSVLLNKMGKKHD